MTEPRPIIRVLSTQDIIAAIDHQTATALRTKNERSAEYAKGYRDALLSLLNYIKTTERGARKT